MSFFWKPYVAPEPETSTGCGCGNSIGGSTTKPSETGDKELRLDRESVVPILYGERKLEGIPIIIGVLNGYLYVVYIFCEGEIDSFGDYFIDGKASTLSTVKFYTGTLDQPVDGDINAVNPEWQDHLSGTAYAACRFWSKDFSSLPKLSAVVKGLKVYDPRTGVVAYSNNPILCAVDHLRDSRYGGSVAYGNIDWASVTEAANDCDVVAGGEPTYEINYFVSNPSSIDQIQDYILKHCNGNRTYSAGVYSYHVQKIRASVASFTQAEISGLRLSRPTNSEVYNRVRATYTIRETWNEDEYALESAELSAGAELLSEAHFDFTGCGSLSQVHRLAVYRMNRNRADLNIEFASYNLKGLERHDRFSVTHDILNGETLDFVVTSIQGDKVVATEYTEDIFSTEIIAEPVIPEVDLPSPSDGPGAIRNLVLEDTFKQARDGHFVSSIIATWVAPTTPWLRHYEIWLSRENETEYLYATTTDTSISITVVAIEDDNHLTLYTVKVIAVNEWGLKSSPLSDTVYVEGKNQPPEWTDGAVITGAEAGDIAVLRWSPALDRDTVRYEVRRGRLTDTWESSAWVATVDALNYFDRAAPSGEWRYFVKAFDSVGHETATALYTDVVVTINPNLAFSREQIVDLTGATTNQIAISPSGTDHDQAYPSGTAYDGWSERFPAAVWNANPDEPWLLPVPTTGTMDLISAATDMRAQFTGSFTLNYTATKVGVGAASLTAFLLISGDGVTYIEYPAASTVTATARYLKVKFVWTCGDAQSCYIVEEPVYVSVVASPVIEFGTTSVGASGVQPIVFTMDFAAVDKVQLTPQGASPVMALADNLTISGFDIKCFDTSGNATASTVGWKVEGV